MRTSDFDYQLPQELIAQTPLEPRDSSRLLVLHRATGRVEHRRFLDLLEYVRAGDVMVFNQSRVIPARLYGRRADTGGRVEVVLLRRQVPGVWQALGRPARGLRPGTVIIVEDPPFIPPYEGGKEGGMKLEVLSSAPGGIKTVRLDPEEGIDRLGQMPLPPYIHRRLEDPERYQTVYARQPGSAAAPTAGLHFTEPMLERLADTGVELAFVTLHIGLDTFRPVQGEDPAEHQVHTEYYELGPEAAGAVNRAREEGRRIVAVGTTSVRVLEQAAQTMLQKGDHRLAPATGWARVFILPGYRFRVVDALLTNFHLPRSTLLMLVSAFAGREQVLRVYGEAITRRYRFYSFGDCMLIL